MADEADMAGDRMEWEEALRRRAVHKADAVFTGHCHYCHEPLQEPMRWCNGDCRSDWEYEQRQLRLNK